MKQSSLDVRPGEKSFGISVYEVRVLPRVRTGSSVPKDGEEKN
jgi:hypothetical protein